MHISALRRLGISIALVALSIALFSIAASDTSATHGPTHTSTAPSFDPAFDTRLCNVLPSTFLGGDVPELEGTGRACTPDTTPSGNPDIGVVFDIPLGDSNYSQDSFVSTLEGFTLSASHPSIPIGTVMAGLKSTISLGLLTASCTNTIEPGFLFFNATVDNTGSEFAVEAEGTSDRWLTLANEVPGDPTDGTGRDDDAPFAVADKDANVVTRYPDMLNRLFDPDGSGDATGGASPVQPIARYAGLSQVPPAGDWQLLQTIIFGAGDLKDAFAGYAGSTQHPYAKLDASLGNTTITLLNDPGSTISSVSSISDFCSPLATETTFLGRVDTNGDTTPDTNRIDAPASSEHAAIIFTQSQRDQDGDGIQNPFDTCAFQTNVDDPYVGTGVGPPNGGPDTDALDSACDPEPAAKDDDEDGDLYNNSQDLCPLVSNPNAAESDGELSVDRNTAAPDGGPKGDSIGDTCDSEQGGNDTVANGGFFNSISVDAVCITDGSFTDGDGDGWCGGGGNDPNDADATIPESPPTVCAALGGVSECALLTHNGSVEITGAVPAPDSDSDGYSDDDEIKIGTDPLDKCSKVAGHDSWPPDFDQSRVINILDVGAVLPPTFGSTPGSSTYTPRADLNPDNVINILDVGKVLPPTFGSTCTPTYP